MRAVLEMGEVCLDGVVKFARDIAFQAAHDVLFGQSFRSSPFDVSPGFRTPTRADDDDHVQGSIGGSVACRVESMPVGFPLLAGIGLATHSAANADSERSRSGF